MDDTTIGVLRRLHLYLKACGSAKPPKMPGKTWLRFSALAVRLACEELEAQQKSPVKAARRRKES